MPVIPGVTADFPQSTENRTLRQLAVEIADHDNGGNDPDIRELAKASLRDAVREFNAVLWLFNRQVTTITLTNTAVGQSAEFDLPSDWRSPQRAVYLDANDQEVRGGPRWVPFEEKLHYFADESNTSNCPRLYTGFNDHESGKVRFWPRLLGPFQYPKVRLYYFRRIVLPTGEAEDARLNVPQEVEGAIFKAAVANFVAKRLGYASPHARAARVEADFQRLAIEREHRDYGEIW